MANEYRSLDEKPYESHYLHAETIIDHPVEKVWPHVLNIGGWMSAHRLQTLAGEPGKVGHFERVYPHGLSATTGLPHYHLYCVAEIIPYKYIALEVFPEHGGSYGATREKMSFDGILLTDIGGKTKLVFLMVDVLKGRAERESVARRKKELEGARGLLEKYFENLKRLVDDAT
jgi:hypothetical protein